MIRLSELKLNEANPRVIKDDKFKKLVESIKSFPQMMELRPIVVDESNVIQGGNMRYRALVELGYKEVQEAWVKQGKDLTPEQWREFVIKDNVGFGEWDFDMLANDWDAEELQEWGLDLPVDFGGTPEAHEDDCKIPDEIETDIVRGDLFEIGEHRMMCGDATDINDWNKLEIKEKSICFTSPPYNAGLSSKLTGNKTASAKGNFYEEYDDNSNDYPSLIQDSLSNAIQLCDGVCFNVQPLANNKTILIDWLHKNKEYLVDILTWDKGHAAPAMASGVLSSSFEWLVIFNKSNNSRSIPLSSWRGTISNVYSAPPQRNNEFSSIHAATFPIHLPEFIIRDLMNECKGVVDCFIGTGTTMVAAHQLNRRCYGMEIDPKYCQVIIDRMLKLDPTIKIKRNGEDYERTEANIG
jgi:DNA modification methylase